MSADVSHNNHYQYEPSLSNKADVCVLVGHSIEAITSAVVLASLGQRVHICRFGYIVTAITSIWL